MLVYEARQHNATGHWRLFVTFDDGAVGWFCEHEYHRSAEDAMNCPEVIERMPGWMFAPEAPLVFDATHQDTA